MMDPSPILEDISISDVTDERTSILNETNENQNSISNGIRDVEELSPVIYNVSVEKLQHLSIEPELQEVSDQTDTSHNDQEERYNSVLEERNNCQKEILELRSHLVKTEEYWQQQIARLKNDYETRLSKVQKERDSMVVKYAHSEKEVIVAHNQKDSMEKKMKESLKERDVMMEKIKAMNNEKSRVCNMLEVKSNEYFASQREVDRLKEEVNAREIKVRWGQNKLKAETESHQETQSKYEKSVQLIKLLKDEIEDLKRNCNEMKSKQSDVKAINDAHLLEEKARLIMDKQNLEEKTAGYQNALKEFEMVKTRHTQLVEENSGLLSKLQAIQKERSEQEDNINQLKEQVSQQRESLIQAQTKLAEMDGVQAQLEFQRQRDSKHQEELETIKQSNLDLEEDMQRCRAKESELLEFTQRLTETNVRLQSELATLQEKAQSLETQRDEILVKLEEAERKWKNVKLELQHEQENRSGEAAAWTRTVSEKSRLCEDLQTQVRELQNELASVRRKNAINLKELTRELRVTKKRLDHVESSSTNANTTHNNDGVSLGSRTSSNTSINTTGIEHRTPEHSPSPTPAPVNMSPDWERSALFEKMVRVQRDNARKSEKLDFLEEHVQDLLAEVKKKNRIIQFFFAKEDSGSMATEASDRHKDMKLMYQAEMAKHGGIMSSMYNMKTLDDGLNLELCLEINQKLQGVLEDTLLKNITLKDSLSTLGAEVARISQQYQSLLQQQQKQK
ncbi:coiled-coil domain-containing protein 186-like isoform X1 [Daphnia pulicaria]|uniref:coiled-coil domain-containing protein 186-like isoform X1 n=1 Tax=Daphnia pulicaria TaxID=35523 RepID=UPI001EEBE0CF|nr:coiled-coil domain-containing protein 186-like isoform X1 [Daphnia pulicaria]